MFEMRFVYWFALYDCEMLPLLKSECFLLSLTWNVEISVMIPVSGEKRVETVIYERNVCML